MRPILSIVIPTKNRQKYCLATIEQILKLQLEKVEIVVQDNSDENLLQKQVKEYQASNILYNYTPETLSFVDNFTKAMLMANGEYICMVGDDDGILPNIIDVVEKAKERKYDAIIPGLNAVYVWPSANPIVKNGENGYLVVSYLNSNERIIEDIQENLILLLKHGGQNYQQLDIPRLYHGIISRNALEKVKSMTGKYFDGLTPDIYMATALCFTCQKICRLGYPVTISGICPKSGSADSATGRHTGKLEDAPHFKGHDKYEWDDRVPSIYSVESIWAETVLHALSNFKKDFLSEYFAIDVLDGICLNRYPQFKTAIKEHATKYGIPLWRLYYLFYLHQSLLFVKKVIKRIFRKHGTVEKFTHVLNIEEAVDLVMEKLLKEVRNAY